MKGYGLKRTLVILNKLVHYCVSSKWTSESYIPCLMLVHVQARLPQFLPGDLFKPPVLNNAIKKVISMVSLWTKH